MWNSTNNSSILIIAHSVPTATSTPDRTQQRSDMLCTPLEHLSPPVLRARRVLPDLIRRYYSQAARQYSSVNHCWDTIEADIASELSNGFTAQVAFKPHKTNALGAVKKGDGKWRRFTVLWATSMTTHVSQSPTASPPLTTPSITSSSASSSSRKVDLKAAFRYFPSKFALLRLLVAVPLLHRPTHMIWPSNGRGSSGRFPNTSHSQPGATTR